ncbi:MAG: hypothetical protein KBC35_00430 [Candidatus Pacebacteria bacterium]|nr:hypothetical protein [Candidatus Paceibacterota bacterium]
MKRPLLIIIGIVLVLVLVAVWVYILFFKAPATDDGAFADLNFGDTTDTSYVPTDSNTTEEQPVVDVVGTERLRQLTTRPVVGYQDITKTASSTPLVYYVESGTGHIFSINLKSGEEKRISGTTIPSARKAAITSSGQFVMLQSGSGNNAEFVVGRFSSTSESIDIKLLGETIVDFTDTSDNTFLYAVKTIDSVVAKEYNPVKDTTKTLFTVPFREAAIAWGKNANDTHYVYTKASNQLEGYLYQVTKGVLNRLPIEGYGLSAAGNTDGVLYSEQDGEDGYKTFAYTPTDNEIISLPLTIIPEKCTPLHKDQYSLICGGLFFAYESTMPDSWYKGVESFSDDLWRVSTVSGSAEHLISVTTESARNIDMINLQTSSDDARAYFIDSHNNTLWLFELLAEDTNL